MPGLAANLVTMLETARSRGRHWCEIRSRTSTRLCGCHRIIDRRTLLRDRDRVQETKPPREQAATRTTAGPSEADTFAAGERAFRKVWSCTMLHDFCLLEPMIDFLRKPLGNR